MMHPYATPSYAKALSHWGQEIAVPEWGTSLLRRDINQDVSDAHGTYPLAILAPNSDLRGGLERLKNQGLIAVTLILDDFQRPSLEALAVQFNVVRSFKVHHVYQPALSEIKYTSHHRYYVNQARKKVSVGVFSLHEHLPSWLQLYGTLVEHRGLSGIHAFPQDYHANLASMPGVTAVGAWIEDRLVSCHIWVAHNGYVHSHLAASNAEGYACNAAYAVNHESLLLFKEARVINLGGGTGMVNSNQDGLVRFKKGFANAQAHSYVCGAILDPQRYNVLSDSHAATNFFPVYRAPINNKEVFS